nr:MAG: wsv293a-like protein [Marsupenaeus japonicus endogenous nimavirus]
MDTSNAKETLNVPQEQKQSNNNKTILSDFNDNVNFFMGPMYKEIAYMIEEDKASSVTDKLFMIFIISLNLFCWSVVLYRLILYYEQVRNINLNNNLYNTR